MKLKADATYVLVGGLGGLGRGQALFMAKHGARHLAFISRSGDASSDAQAVIKGLSEQGVQTKVYAGDITDHAALERILEDISVNLPPIRGVIHGAMQLDDSVFHKMSFAQWVAATRPKVQGKFPDRRLVSFLNHRRKLASTSAASRQHGFLHHALVAGRYNRVRVASQLRGREYLPGCAGPLPPL